MSHDLRPICKEILSAIPLTVAVIHWGGGRMRGKIAPFGDVDILIVTADDADFHAEDLARLKKKFKKFDLDAYAVRRRDLKKKTIVATGLYGPYRMHELIHYQLKHDSDVIYGDKKVLNLIKPMSLNRALRAILPHVSDTMIPRMKMMLKSQKTKAFLDGNFDVLLVVVRCLYSVRSDRLATKEIALKELGKKYPSLKRLSRFLLNKYIHKNPRIYAGITKDFQSLLILGGRKLESIKQKKERVLAEG